MSKRDTVETADALRIAGVEDRWEWNNAIARGHLRELPLFTPGHARRFTVDDIIHMQVFQAFLDVGATPRWAGHVADQVRVALAKDQAVKTLTIWKVIGKDGKPDVVVSVGPPKGHASYSEIFPLPIASYRQRIRAALREKFRQQ